jgi:hypothetical protein
MQTEELALPDQVRPLDKVALRVFAGAWINRWRAIGGAFSYLYRKDEEPLLMRGMVVALDLWRPTDRDNPD